MRIHAYTPNHAAARNQAATPEPDKWQVSAGFIPRLGHQYRGDYADLGAIADDIKSGQLTVPQEGLKVCQKGWQPERAGQLRRQGLVAAGVSAALLLGGLATVALTSSQGAQLGGLMVSVMGGGVAGAVSAGSLIAADSFEKAPQIRQQGYVVSNQAGLVYQPFEGPDQKL
ncbi:MAG: hypothetical protein KC910_00530 [Candidatus Eremiobacteraeota bacterium]|nr:hypothetical protein [Candidatus Eremiobacteraeota bacterium]